MEWSDALSGRSCGGGLDRPEAASSGAAEKSDRDGFLNASIGRNPLLWQQRCFVRLLADGCGSLVLNVA
jgi:hypothetical protein